MVGTELGEPYARQVKCFICCTISLSRSFSFLCLFVILLERGRREAGVTPSNVHSLLLAPYSGITLGRILNLGWLHSRQSTLPKIQGSRLAQWKEHLCCQSEASSPLVNPRHHPTHLRKIPGLHCLNSQIPQQRVCEYHNSKCEASGKHCNEAVPGITT